MHPDLRIDHLIDLHELSAEQRREASLAYLMTRAVTQCEGKLWLLPERTLTLARIHARRHDRPVADLIDEVMVERQLQATLL